MGIAPFSKLFSESEPEEDDISKWVLHTLLNSWEVSKQHVLQSSLFFKKIVGLCGRHNGSSMKMLNYIKNHR